MNYEATEKLINHLIEHGVNGIFILGSNGEFHVIDEDEKIEMTKRVVEIVNKRVPVYVGTGCCSTRATVRLSQKVEAAGADALSVITPYFLKPTNENLYAHYKAVAERALIFRSFFYNIPKATGCPLDPELVDRLADFDNIQGIKDSSGETDRLQAYAEISKRKELQLLVGSDSKISYAYGLGATGAVAGTSNVIVDTLVGLDKALRAGETEKLRSFRKI
ncbi:MAG: dihydrodipicolinate synthase family protein [Lachnospiraceae bacterium]